MVNERRESCSLLGSPWRDPGEGQNVEATDRASDPCAEMWRQVFATGRTQVTTRNKEENQRDGEPLLISPS